MGELEVQGVQFCCRGRDILIIHNTKVGGMVTVTKPSNSRGSSRADVKLQFCPYFVIICIFAILAGWISISVRSLLPNYTDSNSYKVNSESVCGQGKKEGRRRERERERERAAEGGKGKRVEVLAAITSTTRTCLVTPNDHRTLSLDALQKNAPTVKNRLLLFDL